MKYVYYYVVCFSLKDWWNLSVLQHFNDSMFFHELNILAKNIYTRQLFHSAYLYMDNNQIYTVINLEKRDLNYFHAISEKELNTTGYKKTGWP